MGRNYKLRQTGAEVQEILDRAMSDFITKEVDNLVNYYLKSDTYSRDEITQLFAGLTSNFIQFVPYLPEASAQTYGLKIYLVPSANPVTRDEKDEYITKFENGVYSWEKFGTTSVSIDGYVTEEMLQDALTDYVSSEAFQQALAETVKVTEQTLTDAEKAQARLNIGAQSKVLSGSTAYWNAQVGFVPEAGQIIVYTDYKTTEVDGQTVPVPGIKIGTGNGYVQDIVFLDQADSDALLDHINNGVIHVTAADRAKWDGKLNVTDMQEVVGETLIFNRN